MCQKERRVRFSKEMDIHLQILVDQYDTNNWEKIAQEMHLTQRICKERWENYLSPTRNTNRWTKEEDNKLLKLVDAYGERWLIISKRLPEHTPAQIKNRYRNLLKNRYHVNFSKIPDYDNDDSPDYKISRRQMYCPSSFRPETVQKLLFDNCKKRLEPGNNCVSTDCYSFDSTGHRVRCSKGQIQCAICEEIIPPSEIELDHISPVSRMLDQHATNWSKEKIEDWYNDTDNLQPTCQHCNRSKSDS